MFQLDALVLEPPRWPATLLGKFAKEPGIVCAC